MWPSAVLPQNETPEPKKRPETYVSSEDAYALVASMPYEVAVQIATGETPTHHLWGDRLLTMQHVRAARELATTKGNPVEINARLDGPVKQVVKREGADETQAILALLASLPPLPAQRRG